MRKILVVGATGMLGKPVTTELIKSGYEVTVLARGARKAQQLFPQTRILTGDVFDKNSLAKAFTGQDIVYMNLSVARGSKRKDLQPEREGISNIIAAAKQTGIQRLSYLSSIIKNYQGMNGFNWWVFDIKQAAVNMVKASAIPYTIFYPSTFMETFSILLKGNKLFIVSGSKIPMWFIAGKDYGKQVAKAFDIAAGNNQEYVIQGPEPYTWDEAAKVIVEHFTKGRLKIIKIPIGMLIFAGIFSPSINYSANLLIALNNYPEKFESENTWQDLGRPIITIKQFATLL